MLKKIIVVYFAGGPHVVITVIVCVAVLLLLFVLILIIIYACKSYYQFAEETLTFCKQKTTLTTAPPCVEVRTNKAKEDTLYRL